MRSQAIYKSSAGQCKVCRWGNRLRRYVRNEGLKHIIDHGCGWQDGGCHLLAHAVQKHLGPEAEVGSIASDAFPKGGEHSYAKFRGHYIDSDGAHQGSRYMAEKIRRPVTRPSMGGRVLWTGDRGHTWHAAQPGDDRVHVERYDKWGIHTSKNCRRLQADIASNVGHPDD